MITLYENAKTKFVNKFRVSVRVHTALKKKAQKEFRSMASVVCEVLENWAVVYEKKH